MSEAMSNAQKLRMLMEQEKRLGTQNEIARGELDLKRKQMGQAEELTRQLPGMFGMQPPETPQPDMPAQPAATGGYADRMIGLESGGDPNARNPRSTATGAGQFIDSTWIDMMRRHKPELAGMRSNEQILSLRSDPQLSREMVDIYGKENGARLAAAGFPDNDTTRALAHRFGPQGAIQVLSAQPGTPIANVVGGQVMAANPDLAGKTTGSVVSWYAGKMAGNGGQPPAAQAAPQAASPIAGLPPAAQDMIKKRGDAMWQQASQMQAVAAGMAQNPYTKGMASILEKRAEMLLQRGAWMPQQLPNGMQGYVNAFTGEVKELNQPRTVQTYDQRGMMTTQLDRPGVTSYPQPGAVTQIMGSDGKVQVVDQANPGRVVGEAPLSLEQQSAAQVQSGQRGMTPSQASAASAASRAGAETIAKNTAEEWKGARQSAMDAGQRVAVLDRVEQAMGAFTPGIMADKKLWLGQMATQLGLPNLVNASEGEILKGLRSRMQLALTPRGQGTITESERGLIGAQFEVMMSTPEGAKEMIGMIRRLDKIDMDVAKIYADNAERNGGAPNPIQVQREVQEYLQANPKPVVPSMAAPSASASPPAGFRILNVR
jgi:hypothetical protein